MEASAEACWRLSKACGQWAAESRDNATRIAFREMAAAWRRIAFAEEFTCPELIDLPSSGNRTPTPVEVLASSLLMPSSEQPRIERASITRRERLQNFFPKLLQQVLEYKHRGWNGRAPSHIRLTAGTYKRPE